MKAVLMISQSYDSVLPNRKKNDDGRLRPKYRRSAKAERNGQYLVRDKMTITVDEVTRAVDISFWKSTTANFVSSFVDCIK